MVGHFSCTLNGLFWYIFTELLIFLTDIHALTIWNQTNHYLQPKFCPMLHCSVYSLLISLYILRPNEFSHYGVAFRISFSFIYPPIFHQKPILVSLYYVTDSFNELCAISICSFRFDTFLHYLIHLIHSCIPLQILSNGRRRFELRQNDVVENKTDVAFASNNHARFFYKCFIALWLISVVNFVCFEPTWDERKKSMKILKKWWL